MEIINKVPTYSDGEVDEAFMNEIKNGFALERRTEAARVNQARKEATQEKGITSSLNIIAFPHRITRKSI